MLFEYFLIGLRENLGDFHTSLQNNALIFVCLFDLETSHIWHDITSFKSKLVKNAIFYFSELKFHKVPDLFSGWVAIRTQKLEELFVAVNFCLLLEAESIHALIVGQFNGLPVSLELVIVISQRTGEK